jgi:hypothetical protein
MKNYRLLWASVLPLFGAAASAQVRVPVSDLAAVNHAISDVQAHQLSQRLAQRPAVATLKLDPDKVTAAAGPQAAPVKITGSQVVKVAPPAAARAVTGSNSSAELQVIKTSAAEDALLTRAIAGNDQLRPALASRTGSLITLPGLVRMTTGTGPPLQLKPFIFVNQPLQRDSTGLFKGELLIGVSEIADTGLAKRLPTPLLFQIVGAARSDPAKVLVDSTSPPFSTVEVWLNAAQGALAKLLVVSVFDHAGTEVALPVASELDMDTANGNIAGFGIESTKLMVSLNNVADAPGRIVTLHVQPSGYLDNSRLVLDAKGTAEAELRSGSLGSAQIRATSPGLAPVSATVTYTFPFLTIAASILGGLLGAGVSLLTTPGDSKSAARRLAGAAGFGVLVFAAYVIGINLLPFKPEVSVGALSVFAISGLAAWLGPNFAKMRAGH